MPYRTSSTDGRMPVHVETPRADELSQAQAAGPDPLAAGRDSGKRVRTTEAARALARLPRRPRHVTRDIATHPDFEPHNRRRLEWQRKRLIELQAAHGHVSHGVGAILSHAAWCHAAAEFSAEQAAATGNIEAFKAASALGSVARQHELAAWELCAREGQARKADGSMPADLAKFFVAE